MFFCSTQKIAFKNTRKSPLYSILKLTFPEIFKNKSFCFSQFCRNFFPDLRLGSSHHLVFTKVLYFSKFVTRCHKYIIKNFVILAVKRTQNCLKIFSTFFQFVSFRILRKFSRKFTQNFNKLSRN